MTTIIPKEGVVCDCEIHQQQMHECEFCHHVLSTKQLAHPLGHFSVACERCLQVMVNTLKEALSGK